MCFLGPTFLLTFLKNPIHCETQQRLLQIKRIKNAAPITRARHKDTGFYRLSLTSVFREDLGLISANMFINTSHVLNVHVKKFPIFFTAI